MCPEPLRGVQGFTGLRIFHKETNLLLYLFIPDRILCTDFSACGSEIRMDNDPVAHASISLKNSSAVL
jgi:hypothetical protein